MITPADMTRETRQLPDLSREVRVGLQLHEEGTVPWDDIRAHDVGHVAGGDPVLAAIRAAEDRIMARLYGPAEHLWDVASGLTAVLKCVRKRFPRSIWPCGAGEWPPEYRAFRALLLESALALGLRWSSGGDKFVPQTDGEEGAV